jgi:hypothetical protein
LEGEERKFEKMNSGFNRLGYMRYFPLLAVLTISLVKRFLYAKPVSEKAKSG